MKWWPESDAAGHSRRLVALSFSLIVFRPRRVPRRGRQPALQAPAAGCVSIAPRDSDVGPRHVTTPTYRLTMNPLVATKTFRKLLPGGIPGKNKAAAIALLLGLSTGAHAAADRQVTLAWNANTESNLAGYRLLYGTTPGTYSGSVDAGNTTTATATGLNSGTVYYFVVVAYNAAGQTSTPSAAVSYTVPGTPNTAPNADSFALTVAEDGQAAATLSGSDAEGDPLTYTVVSAPGKGTLTGSGPGLTYRPSSNANGTDSFTYRVSDGALQSGLATVSITITPVSDAPVANAKSVTTLEDTSVPVVLTGTDADGDPLTYSIVTAPAKGTLVGTPPNLTFQPAANLSGNDSFTFRVFDGVLYSNPATVSLNITAVNDPPVATAKSVTVTEDTPIGITLAGSDIEGGSLSFTVLTQPTKGTLSGSAPNLVYTPALDATGADSFTFRVNDGSANSAAATVSLNINAVNDVPVAIARSVSAVIDTALPITLTGTDADGSPLTYAIVTPPAHGSLSGTAPNVTYNPAASYTGADSFTFRVNDGTANSVAATVSITVSAANTMPVATPKTVTTPEDTNVPIVLSGTDADGNTLTYSVLTNPTKGVLSGTPPNLNYVPNANVNGSDSFTFRVNDGTVNSAAATVSISISAVNDAPVAAAKSVTTAKNTAAGIVLSGTDVEGSALTYAVLTSPAKGVLSGSAPNLTYTPNTNATGADSFTYRVGDGSANSAAATVSINITNSNSAPQAVSKGVPTMKNKAVAIELSATDAEGSPLTYRVVNPPTSGVLSGTPPSLSFKPDKNFTGNTSFAYVANDGTADSPIAWISIKVKPSNAKPQAVAKEVTANWNTGTAVLLTGTDADSDPLSFSITKQPVNGTLSGTPPNLVYVPNAGFKGKDSFAFVATDGFAKSAAATVSITVVNPSNRAPSQAPWSLSTPMKSAVSVALRATDADGDAMSYRIVSKPLNGKLSGKVPNLVFKPKAKFVGVTSFTYVANDGSVDSAPITVTLHVTQPPETAPRGFGKAKAGTVPDPMPSMSLFADPSRPGVILLQIAGTPGESYMLEHSPDLTEWANEREILMGEEGSLELEVLIPEGAKRGFYRLNTP